MEALIDKPTAAEKLGTTVRHIDYLIGKRRIPFVRVGRFIRFKPSELEAWIAETHTEAVE